MGIRLLIENMEAITPDGNHIHSIAKKIAQNGKRPVDKIRVIENFDFYKQEYNVHTRIDKSSQLCIHSTALTADGNDNSGTEKGLITVSKFGSPTAKENYFEQLTTLEETSYASPKLFVQSICNIPNSMAAIQLGIKGICNHYVGDDEAAFSALWQAGKCIKSKLVKTMYVTSFDTFSLKLTEELTKNGGAQVSYHEASASIRIKGIEEDKLPDTYWEIKGFGFSNGTKDGTLVMKEIFKNSEVQPDEVKGVLLNIKKDGFWSEMDNCYLEEYFSSEIPIVSIQDCYGEYFSSTCLFSLSLLNQMLQNTRNSNVINRDIEDNMKNNPDLKKVCDSLKNGGHLLLLSISKPTIAGMCLKYKA